MKKILHKNYSSLMGAVAVFLLIGITACATKVNEHFDIAFTKPPALESLYDIVLNRCDNIYNNRYAKYDYSYLCAEFGYDKNVTATQCESYICAEIFGYDKNITTDQLKKMYRLAFYIKMTHAKYNPRELQLLPCDSHEVHTYPQDYPVREALYEDDVFEAEKTNYFTIYFDVEKLKKIGYITSDQEEQKDLCLFYHLGYAGSLTKKTQVTSNELVITAEEINRLMDEYTQLKGGAGK